MGLANNKFGPVLKVENLLALLKARMNPAQARFLATLRKSWRKKKAYLICTILLGFTTSISLLLSWKILFFCIGKRINKEKKQSSEFVKKNFVKTLYVANWREKIAELLSLVYVVWIFPRFCPFLVIWQLCWEERVSWSFKNYQCSRILLQSKSNPFKSTQWLSVDPNCHFVVL